MPLDFLASAYLYGLPGWLPSLGRAAQVGGTLAVLAATKRYCSGTPNTSERAMHGRVVMITGGTSGIGAVVALELAKRGAHVVLLTPQPPSDPFVVDYVEELRARAGHQLVYAEQCDLASLHSVRTFATRWIDSLPVRRLDMVVLCAAVDAVVQQPSAPSAKGGKKGGAATVSRGVTTPDGIERAWQVNYLANFHLLGLLSPALRAQPFDRDVRVIVTACSSYIGAPPLVAGPEGASTAAKKSQATPSASAVDLPDWTPRRAYARSKLALMVFARAFQKHVDAYKRPDGLPGNVRVLLVDPGAARTPGFRRWLTGGSLLGLLLVYVLFYPLWWLLVKSADDGAQSVLFAAMDAQLRRMRDFGAPGEELSAGLLDDPLARKLVKECRLVDSARRDVDDEAVAKALWEDSDRLVELTEKRGAERRKQEEKEKEAEAAQQKEAEQKAEIAALVGAIKQGQAREKEKEKEKQGKKGARRKA